MISHEQLQLHYDATQIPVFHFAGNILVKKFDRNMRDFNLPLLLLNSLPSELPFVWHTYTPEFLYFGGICLPKENYKHSDRTSRLCADCTTLLLGPVLLADCSRKQADQVCQRIGRSGADISIMQSYLSHNGNHSVHNLLANIQLLCHLLNLPVPQNIPYVTFNWNVPYHSLSYPEPIVDLDYNKTFEQKLCTCISSGNLDTLNQILHTYLPPNSAAKSMPLSYMRSYILGINMLLSRTASSAGIGFETAYTINLAYTDRITLAGTKDELSELFFHLVYEYARKVAEHFAPPSASPVVNFIQKYIIAHYDQKISPSLLADQLHMSCPYLCNLFKKETGTTISSYVQQEKIREAKLLLERSLLSIIEISEILAFSSKSYFCAVFKKITGMTPVSYRNSKSNL